MTELHRKVYEAFLQHGVMNDDQLERLRQFKNYAPSTVRKRRSELFQARKLAWVDTKPNRRGVPMHRWTAR